MKKPLIILTGPTAVGKTDLSVNLAKEINGEIISADSMQVYRYMDIGTAKIKPEEMKGIKHYLIDILDPRDDFNVYMFKEYALNAVNEIYSSGKIPIITGGTGFYIQSVLYDVDFNESAEDSEYRKELKQLARENGPEYIHAMLENVDKASAQAIHYRNEKRVIRALEYYRQTGRPISLHNEEQRSRKSPFKFIYLVLNDSRDILYERIDKRVEKMFEAGLYDEVMFLKNYGCTRDMTSMKAIGYREFFDCEDEYNKDRVMEAVKTDTRHFAKRQLTWFRRERDVEWVELNFLNSNGQYALDYILDLIKEKDIII